MRALEVSRPGEIRMIDIEKPVAGPLEVLARIHYCGICGTDMAIYTGDSDLVRTGQVHYPVKIGHEWSGVVEQVGPGVVNVCLGDKVVSIDAVLCGQCRFCIEKNYSFCPDARSLGTVGDVWAGGFAEYIKMPASHVYKLRKDIDLAEASLIEPAGIAMSGLMKAGVFPGCTIMIVGTGAIGLAAVALARQMGAARIILAGRRDAKLQVGLTMGADILVNTKLQAIADAAKQHSYRNLGVDILLESSGSIEILDTILDCVHPQGVISLIGFYEYSITNFPIDKLVLNQIDLRGAAGSISVTVPIINYLENARLSFKPLISGIYPFEHFDQAFSRMLANDEKRIKILLRIT
ncbi:MAG: alcohol dehydrogenase catalytic domain-containing protein [Bacillota bacterium]|nr:alcohol dehydrogenase catalytic domain-containing protein [Bacillota bacterium]